MAAVSPETRLDVELPPTPNFSLNRVGSLFVEQASPSGDDSTYYVLGSIGRLCNEVDDITLAESSSSHTVDSSSSPKNTPVSRVPTGFNRDTPVFSWESRISDSSRTLTNDGASLDAMAYRRQKAGSSLAPQSSSDPSDDEKSEAPSVGQFRPGTDLIQCPVPGCERTFKWKKNLHHHIRDKHPTDVHGLSVLRIQPAHVGAAHNGFRLQSIAIAPQLNGAQMAQAGDTGLRCPECGKMFARKGDLVHHKRYHTRSTDRPYKCPQCNQGFIHYKDLSRHMPRHTGQRSFQCPYPDCHKNYTRKDNLNRHMRHDHGGLGVYGEVWTGVEQPSAPPPVAPVVPIDPQVVDPDMQPVMVQHQASIPLESLAAIAEAAQNQPILKESRSASASSEASNTATGHYDAFRETTPALGKRPADDLDRLATGSKPKRRPKEKWAHRLGCPFRKCRNDMFTTENGFRVCETTPHEFIIRLIEHMKRNHELYVCGECYVGFKTPDALSLHKSSSHHCPKCYVSFPTEGEFVEHFEKSFCMPVEASTQEDIWQILYETLCGDGVRHNPSFDDDTAISQILEVSNSVRMQFLAHQPLSQGQVPPLAQQLRNTPPMSGNGTAPPVSQAEVRHQLVSGGANLLQHSAVKHRASSPSSEQEAKLLVENRSQRETISMLQGLLAVERQARVEAEIRADIFASARVHDIVQAAVRRMVSSIRRPQLILTKPRHEPGWVEEIPIEGEFLDGDAIALVTPREHRSILLEDSEAEFAIPEFFPSLLQERTNAQPLRCPSLTSDDTLQTVEEVGAPVALIPPSTIVESPSKDAQEPVFWWNQLWNCQECGGKVREFCVVCDTCAAQ